MEKKGHIHAAIRYAIASQRFSRTMREGRPYAVDGRYPVFFVGGMFMKATRWAGLFLCFLLAVPVRAAEPKSALLMDAATGTVLYENNAHEATSAAVVCHATRA